MHFTKDQIHRALQHLKNRVEAGTHWENVGICSNLSKILQARYGDATTTSIITAVETTVSRHARDWSEFSGNEQYPVPCDNVNPWVAYVHNKNLWIGEYGAARKRLLDFLIERTR